MFSMTTKK